MKKYIAKIIGKVEPDAIKVARAFGQHHVEVVDGSMVSGAALVRMEPEQLAAVQHELNEWQFYPEVEYELPSTRKTIKRRIR